MCYVLLDLSQHKLYKLMENFFPILNSFLNYWPKTKEEKKKKFKQISRCKYRLNFNALYISMDLTQQALQTNGKVFSNFEILFPKSYNFF